MRATVTLDPDTEQIIRRRMRERGISLEEAINEAIRSSVRGRRVAAPFRTETSSHGRPTVDLDAALHVVADLEDDALMRRMRSGR